MKIAVGYKMRSGKDTSVDYLIGKYGGTRITFAKYIYQALYSVQDIFKLNKGKDREFLQIVGDWARKKDSNIFVNLVISEVENDTCNYFCNDLRFLNEFQELKGRGWVCIKINRNIALNYEEKLNNHISEHELDKVTDDKWDYIIDNNSSLEDLYKKLDEIVLKL